MDAAAWERRRASDKERGIRRNLGGSLMRKKLLIVQVAALGEGFRWPKLELHPLETVFPALTCTVAASFRTASPPAQHGVVGNGWLFRELARPMFWEQSAALVCGPRIWQGLRSRGGRVGMMFWQQSLGESVDLLLSPAPIHKHHGGMIQACYCKPDGLYETLCKTVGRKFNLMRYWGPMASAKVGDWIAAATAAVMADADLAPDLLLSYLPSLDCDFQRWGPRHPRSQRAVRTVTDQLDLLLDTAEANGYDLLVFGDYAIGDVTAGAVLPNRALAGTGMLATRNVRGMLYPDFHTAAAFAVADHEIAHVYVRRQVDVAHARDLLAALPGVGEVMDRDGRRQAGLDHPNSGELVLVAAEGCWFAYPWWTDNRSAPDYAAHVDIHNKPGYDPCELFFSFFDWPPMGVSRDTTRIRGSHGRAGPRRRAAWASSLPQIGEPRSLIELAATVKDILNEQ